jgi:GNAT superfamily N-acetyltransferase
MNLLIKDTQSSPQATSVTLRGGRAEDAVACGSICYEAFKHIAEQHGFPPDLPSCDVGIGIAMMALSHPGVYSVIAEADGKVVGSNFLWEADTISGVGPVSVDPSQQNASVGRQLMAAVLERAEANGSAGVRLVQSGYHCRSLSLYAKMGFVVREPLVHLKGAAIGGSLPGFDVKPTAEADIDACCSLCYRIHGHDRRNELLGAIRQGTALRVEREGRITGYATSFSFFGHAVGETNDDVKALLRTVPEMDPSGFLLPTRNADLFRWCLENGLRVNQTATLMSIGLYNEPAGAFLPSILY